MAKSKVVRTLDADDTSAIDDLANYREAQRQRTQEQIAEERAEARAAMGPGVKMVNILTGETYTT